MFDPAYPPTPYPTDPASQHLSAIQNRKTLPALRLVLSTCRGVVLTKPEGEEGNRVTESEQFPFTGSQYRRGGEKAGRW